MQDDGFPEDAEDWVDVIPDERHWDYYISNNDNVDYFVDKEVAKQLNMYVLPFLLILGTFGNILATIVLWKFIEKVLSTCLYIFVVQIVDLMVLYLLCGNDWLATITKYDIKKMAMHSNTSVCKIYPFVLDLALHLSMWMMVAMAVETMLVLSKPKRLMRFCRMERVRSVILLILVLLICVNAHAFWTYIFVLPDDDHNQSGAVLCSMIRYGSQQTGNFRKIIWPLFNFLIADFLPYFTIFACTVSHITVRIKRKDHLRQLENTWKAYSVDSTAARELQIGFLALCLAHLVLLLPKMACDMFNYLVQPYMLYLVQPFSFRLDSKRILAEGLGNILLYMYLSIKCFVLLGCCKAFRTEVWSLLTCISCKTHRQVNNRRHEPPIATTQQPLLIRANHEPIVQENCVTPSPRKAFSMTSV